MDLEGSFTLFDVKDQDVITWKEYPKGTIIT